MFTNLPYENPLIYILLGIVTNQNTILFILSFEEELHSL